MSWIAVMVGVGVGATAGGVTTGLNGGSTEDILKSMAIGGAMGGAGGGIGGAVFGGAGGAAAGAGGGAAAGGTTGGTTGALSGSATGTLGAAGNAAATSAITPAFSSATTGAIGGGTGGGAIGGGTGGAGFAGLSGGSGLLAGGTGGATGGVSGGGIGSLGASGNQAAVNALNPQSAMISPGTLPPQPGSPDFIGATATPDQIANASAYTDANMGTRFLADLTNQQGNIVGNTGLKMAGGALQSGVMNAGINGLLAGAQGQDVGKAMGMGAATGAVGGAAGAGLASMAGSGGTLGSIGNFAAKHDVLVPGALSMGSNMALSRMMPDSSDNGMPESSPLKSKYRWNPDSYNAYLPRGNSFGSFAAGGITDLDNYDQTPQMQSPGTLDIPNRNEVANNQGYMGDSVQMMAHGGVAKESYMLEGVGGNNLHREASQDLRDYLEDTPDTELTPEQRKQKAILFAKKMAMGGMAYAHGGISDLGGYSDGGRLLKGPGNGVSDDIPATIAGKQPARLATNEFVVPARIVSEIGNGSTDAGAKALYAMMDRVQKDRSKSMGKGKFAVDSKASRHLDSL